MENQINTPQQDTHKVKTIAGVFLLALGSLILLNRFSFFIIPHWLFSWPMFLIAFGIYRGAKSNFKKPNWVLLPAIGIVFLLPNIIPSLTYAMLWPVPVIFIGLHLVLRRKQRWNGNNWERV